MTYEQDLATHLREFRSAPFLFVGSGMSRRYLGLETWAGLLERFSEHTGKPYAYYASSGDGQLPKVAGSSQMPFTASGGKTTGSRTLVRNTRQM